MAPSISLTCANPDCSKLLTTREPRVVLKAKKGTYDGGQTVATLCSGCAAAVMAPLTLRPPSRAYRRFHPQ